MAGSTPYEAVQDFLEPISLALSCITRAVPDVSGGYFAAPEPHRLTLSKGEPIRLQGDTRLSLTVIHYYHVIEDVSAAMPWRVITTTYLYSLDDSDSHEIIAFHWHPARRGTVSYPHLHLHLGYGAGSIRDDLANAHVPTGHIVIQDVIQLAIRELGAKPLRDDWEDVLQPT